MLTDPVADMLTRIRNANKALHDRAEMPNSKLKVEIARILKEEGYIRDFHVAEGGEGTHAKLVVELKYGRSRERVLTDLKRISKPGRRIYAGKDRRRACSAAWASRSCPRPAASSRAAPPRPKASAAKSSVSSGNRSLEECLVSVRSPSKSLPA